jgi:hypothetical protein
MTSNRRNAFFSVVGATAFSLAFAGTAFADTVYLKNGNWIDGTVRSRSQKTVEVEIGTIGKVEIPADDVHLIYKNGRTGTEYVAGADGRKIELEELAAAKKDAKAEEKDEKEEKSDPSDDSESVSKKDEGSDSGKESSESDSDEGKSKADEKKIAPELKARIENLVAELQRQKPQSRVRAERHLKAIGQPSVPYLLPLTKNESDLVRTAVFRLFNDFGDDSVIEACISGLLDPNEYVRDFANRTLQRITREDFGFQANASPRRREAAYDKWRKWWDKEKAELEKVEKLKSSH